MKKDISTLCFLFLAALPIACSAPRTSHGADLGALLTASPPDEVEERPSETLTLAELLAMRPRAPLPAALAVVRVQDAPRYEAGGLRFEHALQECEGWEDRRLVRLGELPQVTRVRLASELLSKGRIENDVDLRRIGGRLGADVLLVYTIDSSASMSSGVLENLAALVLPMQRHRATATVRALLMDVRSGYVYASEQNTASERTRASVWGHTDAAQRTVERAERGALEGLVERLGRVWSEIEAEQGA